MSDNALIDSIARLVPTGSRVLDLGCGNGEMLAHLVRHRQCTGYGVEIDDTKVHACLQRGVNVLQLNLEDGLSVFERQEF
jgi:methionine biosynthesis protein MetW